MKELLSKMNQRKANGEFQNYIKWYSNPIFVDRGENMVIYAIENDCVYGHFTGFKKDTYFARKIHILENGNRYFKFNKEIILLGNFQNLNREYLS